MPSVMEALYYGYLRPDTSRYSSDSSFAQADSLKKRNLDKLTSALNDSEKELLEKYCDAQDELEDIIRYDTFARALKFGLSLMAEAFTSDR